ncbi:hypothetical protein GQ457_10G023440 [Hibiscus cannabinus]
MENRFKDETRRIHKELEMVHGSDACEAEVEALRIEVEELLNYKSVMSEWGALTTFLEEHRPGKGGLMGCTEKNRLIVIVKAMDESSEGGVAKLGAKVVTKTEQSSGSHGGTKSVKPRSRSQGGTTSAKAVKLKAEQLKCYLCKGPHKLRKCPNRVKPSKEEDKLEERSKVAKLGSLEVSSAKACDQVQNGLLMFEKANEVLVEGVRGENTPLETTIAKRSKEAEPRSAASELVEDVRRKNMPLETTIVEKSKEAKPDRDIPTMDTPPMGNVGEKSRPSRKKS